MSETAPQATAPSDPGGGDPVPTSPAPRAAGGAPPARIPAATPLGGGGFELWASRAAAAVPGVLLRIPFTVAVVVSTLLIGLLSRTIWTPITGLDWFPYVAHGVPPLREGRVWTLLTGPFFASTPSQYVLGLLGFLVLVGACELRIGTLRVAVAAVAGQVGGLLVASGALWLLAQTPWTWAQEVAQTRDVGFTTAMLTVVAVTSATLRSPWRLRVRALLWFSVTVAVLFVGTLAQVAHAVAVAVGLLVGQRLYGVEPGFGPRTRRETRMLAFGGLLMIGITELVVLLFPGRGPFGATTGLAGSAADVLVDLLLIALVANALRNGKRWAWWATVVYGGLNVVVGVLALAGILLGGLVDGAPLALGGGLLWLGELALVVINRRAFHVPWRRRVPGGLAAAEGDSGQRARALLTSVGGSTMAWMTLWPEMRYSFMADGRGYVGYERHAGVALALADPVVPADTVAEAVREFTTNAESGGLIPCLFSVTEAAAAAARAAGWRTVQIAEDTLIDLPGLEFKGKKWQNVRSALNKARKEGVEFRMVTLAEQPFAVLAQVRAISEEWVGDKGLPEMGFTLGGVEEALDPAVRVGIAVDPTGSIHGVTSWLPVYAPGGRVRGWTLDVMRRRTDGFRSVMEFMIASACQVFGEDGAEFVSLSGAPLARGDAPSDELERMDRVLDKLGSALEPFYGFRSLHAFKAKFSPRYEPIYLAYRDEADLPRIGIALTRAYLPDATPRQLLAATRSGGQPAQL